MIADKRQERENGDAFFLMCLQLLLPPCFQAFPRGGCLLMVSVFHIRLLIN